MLLCSPVSLSCCLHLLALSDLLLCICMCTSSFFSYLRYLYLFFLLLCSNSCTSCFYMHASLTTEALISSMFYVFILYMHLLLPPCAMPLNALHSVMVLLIRLFTATPPFCLLVPSSISLLFIILHRLLMSIPLVIIMETLHLF
jgi:hypothetical protein